MERAFAAEHGALNAERRFQRRALLPESRRAAVGPPLPGCIWRLIQSDTRCCVLRPFRRIFTAKPPQL